VARAQHGLHLFGRTGEDDELVVRRQGGAEYKVSLAKYEVVSRGGKGRALFTRGQVEGVVLQEPTLPGFPAPEGEEEGS